MHSLERYLGRAVVVNWEDQAYFTLAENVWSSNTLGLT